MVGDRGEEEMSEKKATLLWMDLEMTGLSPKYDRILEVACVATDWDFEELGSYEAVVKCDEALMKRRMVGEFWEKNEAARVALQEQNKDGKPAELVEKEILDFVKKRFGKDIYLAGNSIHQDRKFIESEWPTLNKMLHYRMLDVSAWKIYFEGALGKRFLKPEAHRAVDDIRGSMEELKWYLKQIS